MFEGMLNASHPSEISERQGIARRNRILRELFPDLHIPRAVPSFCLWAIVTVPYPALQIYGEEEKIYGYKNLTIDVRSRHCSTPHHPRLSHSTLTVEICIWLITPILKRPLRVETRLFLDGGRCGSHSIQLHTTGYDPLFVSPRVPRFETSYQATKRMRRRF